VLLLAGQEKRLFPQGLLLRGRTRRQEPDEVSGARSAFFAKRKIQSYRERANQEKEGLG
jgi:hypothetical protein